MSPRDPEEAAGAGAPAVAAIPEQTTVGEVHLTVADADRSAGFYESEIGLRVRERGDGRLVLGGDRDLLVLHEVPGATPAHGFSGLYHFALLLPERADLARWLVHAARDRVPLTGLSDHFVSEAIYLNDPDGHGIEIYWDRPREVWEGQVEQRMTTLPLDTDDLLGVLDDPRSATFEGLPGATTMGHVHLRVADIDATVHFYRDLLGMALMAQLGPQAAFLSAGGYHHHLGANVWESRGRPQPPPGRATLELATIVLPDAEARDRLAAHVTAGGHEARETETGVLLNDPSGNPVELRAAA
jgi:catechol 2,3-dioxygenase